jgi:uncharacterized membrane protein YedE/YeeE
MELSGPPSLITAPGLWLIKRYGRPGLGRPVVVPLKPQHRGNIAGGILFGIGWSICGMCPGPIFVNIGEGKIYAVAALAGALAGAGLFGAIYTRIQSASGCPGSSVGTGGAGSRS